MEGMSPEYGMTKPPTTERALSVPTRVACVHIPRGDPQVFPSVGLTATTDLLVRGLKERNAQASR